MNNFSRHALLSTLVIWLLIPSQDALSSPLLVKNHSFEDFVLLDGQFSQLLGESHGGVSSADPIPFWSVPANAGTWNNNLPQLPGGTTDGDNTVWLHNTTISQVLTDVLIANTRYDLSIDVGFTVGGGSPGYRIQLLAGSTVVADDNNSLSLPFGSLITSSISFDSLPGNLFLGQNLSIKIQSFGIETIFDNVRLDANSLTNVSEPATLAIFGLGLAGLGFMRRRRAA